MQAKFALLQAFLLTVATSSLEAPAENSDLAPCPTIDVCVAQLRIMAQKPDGYGSSMTKEEQKLIGRLLVFDDVVPRLVGLLADPNTNVANIAAAALRDVKAVDPAFLPQVKAGLDRGLGWLAPALGRMHSDEAAREAVARYLVSKSAPHNQEAYAVKLSGRLAVPYIVEAARCRSGCKSNDFHLLGYALGEMGTEGASAGPGLMEIASNPATPRDFVAGVLTMIAAMGNSASPLEGKLQDLRQSRPDLEFAIDEALIGIGSNEAGEIYTRRIRNGPDVIMLRDVAEAGSSARNAGPALLPILEHPDPEVRLAAVRALGYIGWQPAAHALIPLLEDPRDVRLNWAAAESLGRLGDTQAEKPLGNTALNHWYPPVRQAAVIALQHLRDRTPYKSKFHENNFPFDFFSFQSIGHDLPTCDKPLVKAKYEPDWQKLHARSDGKKLSRMTYTTTILSYGAADPPVAPIRSDDAQQRIIEVTPDNIVEHRKEVSQAPDVALRVEDGWLVGSDRGEWGGELMFLSDDGSQQALLSENIEDIYFLGDRIVAVAGLAHLGMNSGMIYALSHDPAGTWSATAWRALPGAPISSWLVDTHELLVNTVAGGSLLISPAGAMRLTPCKRHG